MKGRRGGGWVGDPVCCLAYTVSVVINGFTPKQMQLHTGAEHFGNVIFLYRELTSKYHIDVSIDVNLT